MLKVQGGTGGGEGGRLEEYDWEGNLVWEFNHATRDYQLHHDFKVMPNGHILALMVERKSREEAVAAGFDASLLRDDYLVPDAVVEIEPLPPKGGRIVWEWHVWDHLIQDFDRAKPNFGDVAAPSRVGLCRLQRTQHTSVLEPHEFHRLQCQARPDVCSARAGDNEIWFVDHSTTAKEAASHTGGKGGDLIYRWGNPAAYKRGAVRDKQLVQQHDAQWIPEGYPGVGHLTIFNNGYDRGWSSIEEIAPPMDVSGHYLLEPGKAFGPEKPVWHYEATNRTDFFSSEISGAHRLPNGNTLVCAGVIGHLFEITPNGEIAWQYVNPMVRGGILAKASGPAKTCAAICGTLCSRHTGYAPDYPGLAGRDLSSKGVIELPGITERQNGP